MTTAVKKTISLPPDLARETEEIARTEGKTVSGVIQDALRSVRAKRLKKEFHNIKEFWSRKAIIHEVLDVLARKFDRDKEELARVAVYLTELGEMVRPRRKIRVLSYDPDNRILECAISGEADVIVTGDKATLNLGEYKNVKIVSLKEFLEYV